MSNELDNKKFNNLYYRIYLMELENQRTNQRTDAEMKKLIFKTIKEVVNAYKED